MADAVGTERQRDVVVEERLERLHHVEHRGHEPLGEDGRQRQVSAVLHDDHAEVVHAAVVLREEQVAVLDAGAAALPHPGAAGLLQPVEDAADGAVAHAVEERLLAHRAPARQALQEDGAQRVGRYVGEAEVARIVGVGRVHGGEALDGRAIGDPLHAGGGEPRAIDRAGVLADVAALVERERHAHGSHPHGEVGLAQHPQHALAAEAHGHVLEAGVAVLHRLRGERLVLRHEVGVGEEPEHAAAHVELGVLVGDAVEEVGAGHALVEAAEGIGLVLADAQRVERLGVEVDAVARPAEQRHRVPARHGVEGEAIGGGVVEDGVADVHVEPGAGRCRGRSREHEVEHLGERRPGAPARGRRGRRACCRAWRGRASGRWCPRRGRGVPRRPRPAPGGPSAPSPATTWSLPATGTARPTCRRSAARPPSTASSTPRTSPRPTRGTASPCTAPGASGRSARARAPWSIPSTASARSCTGRSAPPAPSACARCPPRLRETSAHLAGGLSEKQIAEKLAISQHTVHDYVKELHRRFGVQSRGALLARCLDRGTVPVAH